MPTAVNGKYCLLLALELPPLPVRQVLNYTYGIKAVRGLLQLQLLVIVYRMTK